MTWGFVATVASTAIAAISTIATSYLPPLALLWLFIILGATFNFYRTLHIFGIILRDTRE